MSEAECSSPSICIKDTLYPMRKELQAKLNATIKTPLKNKKTKSKKETVINSPWIKPGGNNASGRHSKKTFKTATWTRHNCWGRSGSSRCELCSQGLGRRLQKLRSFVGFFKRNLRFYGSQVTVTFVKKMSCFVWGNFRHLYLFTYLFAHFVLKIVSRSSVYRPEFKRCVIEILCN